MKVWKTVAGDREWALRIERELGLPTPLAEVLAGLPALGGGAPDAAAALDEVTRFLHPRLSDLADPFVLPAMDVAAARIWRAIERGEAIAVYGDYDVDGITSTGLLIRVLTRLGAARVTPCLPSRMHEGYGLSVEALSRCLEQSHPRLLITVDCGTNALEAARLARAAGVDVIVTDHHEPSGAPADVLALVNPKLGADEGAKILAGVGVVFKLCHALIKTGRAGERPAAATLDLRDYLEWVGMGTIADIVPLVGENRILVRHGLARLNCTDAVGWNALIEVARVKKPIDTYHVGYCLGPRLNAVGRLGTADAALELLLTDYPERAREIALTLDAANRERQDLEQTILREATALLDAGFDPTAQFGLVVGQVGWHPGVVGIVASRLAARYRRPTIVIAFDADGMGRGSGRGIEGFNLLDGLEQCRADLLAFGGHEMAAGLELEAGRLESFRARFNQAASAVLRDADLRPVQRIHAWLDLARADSALLAALDQLTPFGQLNPRPVLAARGVRVVGAPRRVGKNHLRLTLAGDDGRARAAIAFGMAEQPLPDGPLDVAFHLERDTYQGGDALQLNVQDLRASA